jgi:ubiquinone/menaquinone biosynthesis C-methylase UbiE
MNWWENYFDEIYLKIYFPFVDKPERIKKEVDFIEKALELKKDMKILDLACGQGRHAIEFAKRGYKITGLDYSDYLLKVAEEKAKKENLEINFLKGDMRELPFNEEFDAIYNFFTSFGYFSDEDNLRVLKSVSKSIKKGGKFLIDTINIFWILKNFQYEMWKLIEDLLVLEKNEFNPLTGRMKNKRIIFKNGKEIDRREFELRLYTPSELSYLLSINSLEAEKFYGDYDGNEYTIDKRRLIILARKI